MADDKKSDEQKYTDPKTGKPIIYAENVPELFRRTDKPMQADLKHAQKLDRLSALERAKLGLECWNLWVYCFRGQWLKEEVVNDRIQVSMKPSSEILARYRSIDFGDKSPEIEPGVYAIRDVDFSYFLFPCSVDFSGAVFEGLTIFEDAMFCRDAKFRSVEFRGRCQFDYARFFGNVNFEGAKFSDQASFEEAVFSRFAGFANTVFEKDAVFRRTAFWEGGWWAHTKFQGALDMRAGVVCGEAHWQRCIFDDIVDFGGSCFLNVANFLACEFSTAVNFDHVCFGKPFDDSERYADYSWTDVERATYEKYALKNAVIFVPNFKGAQFELPPNLGYTEIAVRSAPAMRLAWYERLFVPTAIWRIGDKDAASKLRRLQGLAAEGHHHLVEKRFFRAELLSRRGYEAGSPREVVLINLFERLSMCGLSFRRPVLCWLGLFAVFFAVYGGFAGLFEIGWSLEDSFHLVNYTFSNATPVLGVIKASDSAAVQALFNGDQPPWVTLLAGLHNLISTTFLFFALLAIRNYFKLG